MISQSYSGGYDPSINVAGGQAKQKMKQMCFPQCRLWVILKTLHRSKGLQIYRGEWYRNEVSAGVEEQVKANENFNRQAKFCSKDQAE